MSFESNNTIQIGGKSDDSVPVERVNTTVSNETLTSNANDSMEPIKTNISAKHGGMKLTTKKKEENRYY